MAWEDSEPTIGDAFRAAYRQSRNAVRRSPLTLLPGLLLATLVFVMLRGSAPRYTSSVTFHALQGWERAPGTDETLRAFVMDNVLSRDVLYPVIEANDLYGLQRKRATYLAVNELREDLEVDVERMEMHDSDLSRRAVGAVKVSIAYTHSKRETAVRVTRDIADRFVASSRAATRSKYRNSIARTSREADALSRSLAQKGVGTERSREDAEARLRIALQARTLSLLGAEFETQEQALDFEIVDESVHKYGMAAPPAIAILVALAVGALFSFLFLLLSNVGADLAVDEDDLRVAGLLPLGVIPMPATARLRARRTS